METAGRRSSVTCFSLSPSVSLHGFLFFSTQDRNHNSPYFRIRWCNHPSLLTNLFTAGLTGSSCDLEAVLKQAFQNQVLFHLNSANVNVTRKVFNSINTLLDSVQSKPLVDFSIRLLLDNVFGTCICGALSFVCLWCSIYFHLHCCVSVSYLCFPLGHSTEVNSTGTEVCFSKTVLLWW